MNYRYHSLPRFERSISLDKGGSTILSGNYFYGGSSNSISPTRRIRYYSESPETVYVGNTIQPVSTRVRRIPVYDSYTPTTEHLTASRYPSENRVYYSGARTRSYDDLSGLTDWPTYRFRESSYAPTYSPSYYEYNPYSYQPRRSYYYPSYTSPRDLYYPNYTSYRNSYYPVRRMPARSYYYRYAVLPKYGYNANDYLRGYRRNLHKTTYPSVASNGYHNGFYLGLKQDFRSIRDKMDHHKLLLDRYSSIDMKPSNKSIGDSIMEKSRNY